MFVPCCGSRLDEGSVGVRGDGTAGPGADHGPQLISISLVWVEGRSSGGAERTAADGAPLNGRGWRLPITITITSHRWLASSRASALMWFERFDANLGRQIYLHTLSYNSTAVMKHHSSWNIISFFPPVVPWHSLSSPLSRGTIIAEAGHGATGVVEPTTFSV